LSLWPNGVAALDRLGLGDEVRRRSVPEMDGALRTWRGRPVVPTDGAALRQLLGDVSLIIHRAELLGLLRAAVPATNLITGATCTAISDDGRTVEATFADGSRVNGDLLIGADGLRSVVRASLFGERPPAYSGYTAWRGVTAFDHARLLPGIAIGRGCQFGQVPMADGKVYWFATENAPAGRASPDGEQAALLKLFSDWHEPIADIIRATPEAAILHNDIFDRPPLPHWSRGRVALLGDAAHPMTPNLGQGANQALQDAVALATAIAGAGDAIEPAFAAYEAARRDTANAVVTASRKVGEAMQLESPAACWLRDRLLGTSLARTMQMRQLKRFASRDA
jgi:2-polyprenyl-6-methoxyphenol hydroxylase-like FAD-dependent oxidoreductase